MLYGQVCARNRTLCDDTLCRNFVTLCAQDILAYDTAFPELGVTNWPCTDLLRLAPALARGRPAAGRLQDALHLAGTGICKPQKLFQYLRCAVSAHMLIGTA